MWSRFSPVLVWGVAVAGVLLAWAPDAVVSVLLDGAPALAVLLAAAGFGAWPAAWLLRRGATPLQLACLSCALGLGLLALATLGLGLAGLLGRVVALGFVVGGMLVGAAFLHRWRGRRLATGEPAERPGERRQPASGTDGPSRPAAVAAAVALAIPSVVLLFAASLPPGMLWETEARGYDVLEYHLQGPREYFDAGRITFLPHNVYTSFPQQMEMLYLLLMHLLGDPYAAAVPAQLLSAMLAILAVVAIAAWLPEGWPRLVGLLAGAGVPWLVVLGSLAYVESGMLFFTAAAAGLLLSSSGRGGVVEPDEPSEPRRCGRCATEWWRAAIAAGICAGLAGGCKYTALVLIVVVLPLAWLLTRTRPERKRGVAAASLFAVAALLSFAPWLARNAASTGNPVYPFAYSIFGGRDWSAAQDAQWAHGHHLSDQAGIGGRAAIAVRELFGSVSADHGFAPSLFGLGLLPLALIGVICRRSRDAWTCVLWLVLIVACWAGLTHMPGRFATPIIVPCVMLAGLAAARAGRVGRWMLFGLAGAACIAGSVQIWSTFREQQRWWAGRQVDLRVMPGQTQILREAALPAEIAGPDTYLWLIGDAAVFYDDCRIHYTVVFSRDPWLEFAESGATAEACVRWLRDRGVTHVLFAWSEIERLRRTYGFSPVVTPQWVAGLEQAGLRRVTGVDTPGRALYEVPAGGMVATFAR